MMVVIPPFTIVYDCSRALFSSCASPPTKQKIPRQMSEDFYVVEN